jgi:hypothetical protein
MLSDFSAEVSLNLVAFALLLADLALVFELHEDFVRLGWSLMLWYEECSGFEVALIFLKEEWLFN